MFHLRAAAIFSRVRWYEQPQSCSFWSSVNCFKHTCSVAQTVLPIPKALYHKQKCQYLFSSRFLCPPESSRIVTHFLSHPFSQSLPPAVNRICHSFTSAPQNKAAVSSFLLSTNPTQVPRVPLPSLLLIRGKWPCASLACCSMNLTLFPWSLPLEAFSSWTVACVIKAGIAQRQRRHTATLWSYPRLFSSLSLPKICLFTRSFPSMRLSTGLRKHGCCSFTADLLRRF